MRRREIGFLLVGLALGLMFAVAAIIDVLSSLNRRAFIISYGWDKVFLMIPFLLLVVGVTLVLSKPKTE